MLNLAHGVRNKNKQSQCLFNSVQVKIREGSPEGIRVTMVERILTFKSGVKGRASDRW